MRSGISSADARCALRPSIEDSPEAKTGGCRPAVEEAIHAIVDDFARRHDDLSSMPTRLSLLSR